MKGQHDVLGLLLLLVSVEDEDVAKEDVSCHRDDCVLYPQGNGQLNEGTESLVVRLSNAVEHLFGFLG